MNRIRKIAEGMNVAPLWWALAQHPELWDQHTERTADPASPHAGLHDIWARYCPTDQDASGPHDAVWYPAADLIPVREMVYPMMAGLQGDRLGGVLITRIPAGKTCKPHFDKGWHADHYQKFGVQIASAPGQFFCFEGETLETKPGDVFWFDNAFTHWVTNDTQHDRITMIVCLRTDLRPKGD